MSDTRRNKTMKPTPQQAEQAAELLGVDIFYLGTALREQAAAMIERQGRRVRGFEELEMGDPRRVLWAAEAAEKAWSMVQEAIEA